MARQNIRPYPAPDVTASTCRPFAGGSRQTLTRHIATGPMLGYVAGALAASPSYLSITVPRCGPYPHPVARSSWHQRRGVRPPAATHATLGDMGGNGR